MNKIKQNLSIELKVLSTDSNGGSVGSLAGDVPSRTRISSEIQEEENFRLFYKD